MLVGIPTYPMEPYPIGSQRVSSTQAVGEDDARQEGEKYRREMGGYGE